MTNMKAKVKIKQKPTNLKKMGPLSIFAKNLLFNSIFNEKTV